MNRKCVFRSLKELHILPINARSVRITFPVRPEHSNIRGVEGFANPKDKVGG